MTRPLRIENFQAMTRKTAEASGVNDSDPDIGSIAQGEVFDVFRQGIRNMVGGQEIVKFC